MLAIALLWFLIDTAQIKFELLVNLLHHPVLLANLIFLFLLKIFIGAWRWHLLNSTQGIHLKFRYTLTSIYLGAAFATLLPSAVGGDLVRAYYIFKAAPGKKNSVLISIFIDRIMGLMGIFITISVITFTHLYVFRQQARLIYLSTTCIFFCSAILILFVCFMLLAKKTRLASLMSKYFSHKKWSRYIISFFNTVSTSHVSKFILIQCLMMSIFIQILIVISLLIIAKMMGFPPISFSSCLIAISITQVISFIPVTPGGIGVGEMVFANIVLLLNPSVGLGFATIFLGYRLTSILTYLPGAIFYVAQALKHRLFKRAINNQHTQTV